MNLRDLNYLIHLAESKNFGLAAKLSFVSQPTLSVQIKKLEEELGTPLFERQKKQILLTPAGQIAVNTARQVISEIHDLKQNIQQLGDPLSGPWGLGLFPTLAPFLLPFIIKVTKKELPRLQLRLHEALTEKCIEELQNTNWDAIIVAEAIDQPNVQSELIFTEKFYLAVPNKHPLSNKKRVNAKDIPENEMLLLGSGHCLGEQALNYCQQINKPHQQQFAGTSLETIITMVELNQGVTLIPQSALPMMKYRKLTICAITHPPQRSLYLTWRKSNTNMTCINAWIKLLKSIKLPSLA